MAAFLKDFNDAFFYQVTLICVALIFIDWAIGPKSRAAMREKIAEWWILVDDSSFTGLVASHALAAREKLITYFGRVWYSRRRICRSALLSTLTLLTTLLLFRITGVIANFHAEYAVITLSAILPNALFDWLLLNFTIILLGWTARSTSGIKLALIASIGIFSLLLKALIVFIMLLVVGAAIAWVLEAAGVSVAGYQILEALFGPRPDLGPPRCVECVFEGVFDPFFFMLLAAITGCIWSAFNIVSAIAFAVSKLFRPVVKPIISWLLYRFQESDKGVLTLASVGLGGLAKLAQQGVKLFLAT